LRRLTAPLAAKGHREAPGETRPAAAAPTSHALPAAGKKSRSTAAGCTQAPEKAGTELGNLGPCSTVEVALLGRDAVTWVARESAQAGRRRAATAATAGHAAPLLLWLLLPQGARLVEVLRGSGSRRGEKEEQGEGGKQEAEAAEEEDGITTAPAEAGSTPCEAALHPARFGADGSGAGRPCVSAPVAMELKGHIHEEAGVVDLLGASEKRVWRD